MSKVKNQHFVPQSYLKRFSINEQLFVYDKVINKTPYKTHIRNVAAESYFYDIPEDIFNQTKDRFSPEYRDIQFVEKELSKFEQKFNSLLNNLCAKFLLTPEPHFKKALTSNDREDLSVHLALQHLRTRDSRRQIAQINKTITQMLFDLSMYNEDKNYKPGEYFVEPNPEHEVIDQLSFMLNPEKLLEFSSVLNSHIWFVGVNQTDQPFFTSDAPLVRKAHMPEDIMSYSGLGSKGIELAFPVSNKLIITLCERSYHKVVEPVENLFFPIYDLEVIKYYNSMQIIGCERQVYCSQNKFMLVEEYRENNSSVLRKKDYTIQVNGGPFGNKYQRNDD
ncbi:DUF4238 domain-containing protein [Paenibacillus hemerocallicola]|uniref:DUF4238 domain-containing protein n=1 Tax=Paenibacillus hemerocallicola TaxID=1172614 RepID=UPI00159ECA58|nr:DUF4238 domain-containing protein [Paenibacillus hemerocallicola]